jgi:hypothetical protein
MPDWTERVASAGLPDLLPTLSEAVDAASQRAEGAGEDHVPIRRAAALAALVREYLEASTSDVLGQGTLNDLAIRITSLRDRLNGWASGAEPEGLNQAAAEIDGVLSTLSLSPTPSAPDSVTVAREEVRKLRQETKGVRKQLRNQTSQVESEVVALRDSIAQAQAERQQLVENSTADLNARFDELRGDVERVRGEANGLLNDQLAVFTAVQADRAQAFEDAERARSEAWEAQAHGFGEGILGRLSRADELVNAQVKRLEELREYGEQLAGFIGDTGLAGQYLAQADEQQKTADRWRRVTVGCLAGAALWAVIALFLHADGLDLSHFDASDYLGRLPLALLFAAVAAYAGRQSGHHRRREEDARQRGMQLQTLRLYLAPLEESQRAAITMQLSDRFFGKGDDDNDDAHEVGLAKLLAQTDRSSSTD